MNLDELQRLAENACVMPWERPRDVPYAAKAEFRDAMSPDTAKKLIAVARQASDTAALLRRIIEGKEWGAIEEYEAALRTALEELK